MDCAKFVHAIKKRHPNVEIQYEHIGTTLYVVTAHMAFTAFGVTKVPKALLKDGKATTEPGSLVKLINKQGDGKPWHPASYTGVTLKTSLSKALLEANPGNGARPYIVAVNPDFFAVANTNVLAIETQSPLDVVRIVSKGVISYIAPIRMNDNDAKRLAHCLEVLKPDYIVMQTGSDMS